MNSTFGVKLLQNRFNANKRMWKLWIQKAIPDSKRKKTRLPDVSPAILPYWILQFQNAHTKVYDKYACLDRIIYSHKVESDRLGHDNSVIGQNRAKSERNKRGKKLSFRLIIRSKKRFLLYIGKTRWKDRKTNLDRFKISWRGGFMQRGHSTFWIVVTMCTSGNQCTDHTVRLRSSNSQSEWSFFTEKTRDSS